MLDEREQATAPNVRVFDGVPQIAVIEALEVSLDCIPKLIEGCAEACYSPGVES